MDKKKTKNDGLKKEHPVAKFLGVTFTAICAFIIGWIVKGMMPTSQGGGMPPGLMGAAPGDPLVKVESTVLDAINPPVEFIGRVEPIRDVDLGARISGYVTKVNFEEGALVKEGDLLFEIDPEPYEAVVALRQAELAQAQAEVERAERYLKRLNASDARGITQADMDKAESDVDAGRARVVQARAAMRLAEIDLKHCRIIAPIAGKIGRTIATVGDYVAPSVGTLARIVQLDPIRVVFSITDREYVGLREKIAEKELSKELRTRLRLPTGTVPEWVGQRDFENNEMSAETATLPVRIRFDNQEGLLVPNSYVTVLMDVKNPAQHTVVSERAVVATRDGDFVYVLGDDNKVQKRLVRIGDASGGRVELIEGVKVGERVVTEGVQGLTDGITVKVRDDQQAAVRTEAQSGSTNRGAGEI